MNKSSISVGKKPAGYIAKVKYCGEPYQTFYRGKMSESFIKVDDALIARKVTGYSDLNEDARKKRGRAFCNTCKVERKVEISFLYGVKSPPSSQDDLAAGAHLLLDAINLFEDPVAGYLLIACILAAEHCEALRQQVGDFRPVLHVRSSDQQVADILSTFVRACVPRENWKKKDKRPKIFRSPVLDFRVNRAAGVGWQPEKHIQDFDRAVIKIKKAKLELPVPYDDIPAVVIGANVRQQHEIAPYIENAGVIYVDSPKPEGAAGILSAGQVGRYNPEVLERLAAARKHKQLAAVLDAWSRMGDGEKAWAAEIVKRAKASVGKPDSRFIAVTLNPDLLRNAVFFETLRSFVELCRERAWISDEQAASKIAEARAVFFPVPEEEKAVRRMESPEVFLELLRSWYGEHQTAIAAADQPFAKGGKLPGAKRVISGEEHLVLPEEWLTKTYLRLVKRAKMDCGFAEQQGWMQKIQHLLGEADVLKHSGTNYRYRYDLYSNGTRDTTYVLAIPLSRIEN